MPARVAVAASGGRDSTALLHCTARMAGGLGVDVVALHVNHGLSANAGVWQAHVRAQCRRWHVTFDARTLQGRPARGDSVEAWARRGRYAALAEMAVSHRCGVVLLAHHRGDQAETWLLQALRGAGPSGLAAMPRQAERGGLVWIRPWLDRPRAAIEAYVRRHRLAHVDDESNDDPRYARNRLRRDVWPAFERAFPDAEVAFAGAARRSADVAAVLAEVVADALPALLRGDGIDAAGCAAVAPARRRLLLRAWLAQAGVAPVPETLVERVADELVGARGGARWPAPGGWLRLQRGRLGFEADPEADEVASGAGDGRARAGAAGAGRPAD